MTVDWDGYEAYDPGVMGPLSKLPRAEARAAYDRCMATKAERRELLERLLKANDVGLGSDDASVQDLNDWFYEELEADAAQPGRLAPRWYSVVHDVALFLGDVMIDRHPQLRWEFFTWGKTNVAFQKHVIMGMTTEDPKLRTNIDIDRLLSMYAHRILESRGSVATHATSVVRGVAIDVDEIAARHRAREVERDAFLKWLRMAADRA